MKNNIIVISPKCSCRSAKELASSINASYSNPYETLNVDFSNYDLVINYGFSKPIFAKKVVNGYLSINIAIDKRKTFEALKKLDIMVPYTTDKEVVKQWLAEGISGVAREFVKSSNGKGLTYINNITSLEETKAKFYTQYIHHTHEFRVNVWKDKVISIYDKVRIPDSETKEQKFKFVLYQGQNEHPQIVHIAKEVYKNIGLDFCGIDILCDSTGKLHMLEVNSAPILFPYTLNKLASLIKKEIM